MKNPYLFFLPILWLLIYSTAIGQGNMIVPPGTKVTIGHGTTLDIGGSKLLLMDDFNNAPSFLEYGALSFSNGGKAYVEQYLTKDIWHMVSSPVNFAYNEVYLWHYMGEFDEPSGTWDDINLPLTIPLNTGQGYFAFNYSVDPNGQWPVSPDSVVFDGMLNDQDINVTLFNTDASPTSGWNLLGNPFPVALEWNGDAAWNLNNVQATMYLFNASTGSYETWNFNSGGTNPNGGFIAATQAFWVRTADTVGNPASLTIPASQRSHNNAAFLKSSGPVHPEQLFLTMERNGKADKTIIGFMEEATGGYDTEFDGVYRKASGDVLSLYSVVSGTTYALNELPSIKEYPMVSLHFIPSETGEYTLSATWTDSFKDDQPIYLEDTKTGIYYNLREQSENNFYADISDDTQRFMVHFKGMELTGNFDDLVKIYSHKRTVNVFVPQEMYGTLSMYDIAGKEVMAWPVQPGTNTFQTQVKSGNYIVSFIANEGTCTKKINIQ
ncbi:MAG: T9SS type A sorting domain-containing protein [Bacteroidales bacterium]